MTQEPKQSPHKSAPSIAWKIIGVIMVLAGSAMLAFFSWPFILGLILMLFGILLVLSDDI